MKERNKVANVFTDIAPKWNDKGNLIASCIGQKNPFKTEYKNWIRSGMRILDVGCGAGKNLLKIDSEYENCELHSRMTKRLESQIIKTSKSMSARASKEVINNGLVKISDDTILRLLKKNNNKNK